MSRWLFVLLCAVGISPNAFGADLDLPPLRGSSTRFIPGVPLFARWQGFYAGGQLGYGSTTMDFTNAFDSLGVFDSSNLFTAPLGRVSGWARLGTDQTADTSYGGFFGYNGQWDDAVLGVEINYNHTSLQGQAGASRCFSDANPLCLSAITLGDGNRYNVTIDAAATSRLTDYATFRGRGGWAYKNLMPYAMLGLAVGRVETTRLATATGTPTGIGAPFVRTEGESGTQFNWGYAAGVGIDVLLHPNLFVRAEYEFMHLNSVNIDLNTVRVGAGVKF